MPMKDVGYLIKNINDKLKVRADADLKHFDLTFVQSRVLAYLNDYGGEATQKELELFLEVAHPTVVGIVSRMEQKGYLTCRMDESNRRNKLVSLTDKARALGTEMEQNITRNEEALLASLSESEIEQLRHSLMVIYNNL